MKIKKEIKEASKLINASKKIGLITHLDGDGDAFGSMLALDIVLREIGKEIVIFSNEELIPLYTPWENQISYQPKHAFCEIDLLICLDLNEKDRSTIPEVINEAHQKGVKILAIDHHPSNSIGDISDVYVCDEASSSTSELVYFLLREMNHSPGKLASTLLLSGIEIDTMSFNHATRPETFEVVAELLKKGARIRPVVESAFQKKSLATLNLWGKAMERLTLDEKTNIAITYLKHEDLTAVQLNEEDVSGGIVNFLNQMKEPRAVVFLVEEEKGKYKVSLRDNNGGVNLEEIAGSFGGGGHKKSAGFKVEGTLESIIEKIKEKFRR